MLFLLFLLDGCFATSMKIDYLTSAVVRTDPILAPNGLSGHLHTFFGAAVADPSTTYEDLRNANGNSGNVVENKSLYWYPTIYRFDTDDQKYHVSDIWYHSSYYAWTSNGYKAFPDGFKMIIHATDQCDIPFVDDETGSIFHVCGKSVAECVSPGECPNGDCSTWNSFFPAQTCAELEMSLEFPDCWDGESLDSSDHRSHVAYADIHTDECPDGFNTRIPKIFIFTRIRDYPGGIHMFADGTGVFHSDYISGWRESELQYVLDNCNTDDEAQLAPGLSFCDNGPAYEGNGYIQDPNFFTFLDGPKMNFNTDDDTALKLLPLVTPQIDTSHITNEQITGVSVLPGGITPSIPDGITVPTSTTRTPIDPSGIVVFNVDDLVSVNGQESACVATIVNPDDWNGLVTINYLDGITFGEEIHIADLILVDQAGCVGITITPNEGEDDNGEEGSESDNDNDSEEEESENEEEETALTPELTTTTSRLLTTEAVVANPSSAQMEELWSIYRLRPSRESWTAAARLVEEMLQQYLHMDASIAALFEQQQSLLQRSFSRNRWRKAKRAFKRARKVLKN